MDQKHKLTKSAGSQSLRGRTRYQEYELTKSAGSQSLRGRTTYQEYELTKSAGSQSLRGRTTQLIRRKTEFSIRRTRRTLTPAAISKSNREQYPDTVLIETRKTIRKINPNERIIYRKQPVTYRFQT